MLTRDHLERLQRNNEHNRSMDDLTEQDESNMYSNKCQSEDEEADSCNYSYDPNKKSSNTAKDIEVKKLNGKSD